MTKEGCLLMINNNLARFIIRCFFFAVIGLSAISCTKQDATEGAGSSTSSTKVLRSLQAGDFAAGQLEVHFLKHGYQFGAITEEDYLQQARELLNAPVTADVQEKIRSNGDIERFRSSTGEFAVMTKSGRIRTYFKTDERYWMRQ